MRPRYPVDRDRKIHIRYLPIHWTYGRGRKKWKNQ